MIHFHLSARDNSAGGIQDSCRVSCCCLPIKAVPGETNKVSLNYAAWAAPLGGRGLVGSPAISIQNITPAPSSGANLPPVTALQQAVTTVSTPLAGTVATGASDPEALALTFAHVPLYGPTNGTVTIAQNGSYTYTPAGGFVGYDSFAYSATDGEKITTNRVVVTVNPASPSPALPAPVIAPVVSFPASRINVRSPVVEMALAVQPEARVGDVYRATVRQAAMDCDGNSFWHVSCYDIEIVKC